MARSLHRRLLRLEERMGIGSSRLIPYTDAWREYWTGQLLRCLDDDPRAERVPVTILHALMEYEQSQSESPVTN